MTPTTLRRCRFFAVLLLLLLAGGGVPAAHAEFRQSNLWWAPEAVTKGGHEIDRLMMGIMYLTTAVFILTQVVFVYFIVKYRQRKGVKAVYSHGNNQLEIIWTMVPAVIFIALAIVSDKVWFRLRGAAPKDAVTLDLVAYQFGFHVRNAGADKQLGRYSQEAIDKEKNNLFGTYEGDSAGDDDYQSENQLTMPVGKPVNVVLRSLDVIHAFYVPEFRMYQDIVPGREINWVTFVPEKTGHWALACNQLCGSGHFNMQAAIDVVSVEDYEKGVAEKSKAALEKKAAPAAAAAAPALPATVAAVNP